MARIANAVTIREIEQILFADGPQYQSRSWTVAGVECRRDRHRYSGQGYDFALDVVQLRFGDAGRPRWEVVLVTERWTAGARDLPIRMTKWLKLVAGKPADVRDWVRRCRPLGDPRPPDVPA